MDHCNVGPDNIRIVGQVLDIRQSADDGWKFLHQDLDVKKATDVGGIHSALE